MYYTYKILFQDGFYYYGVRKTDLNPEEDPYTGSPVTFAEKWKTTPFTKELIQVFESWEQASEAEVKLIREVFKKDPFCLNRNCAGSFHPDSSKLGGSKKDSEQRQKDSSKGGQTSRNKGRGMFNSEYIESGSFVEDRRKAGSVGGKVSGRKNVESGHMGQIQSLGTAAQHKSKWVNTHPDFEPYISTPCGLSHWQRKRNIPTTFRKRIDQK
jgi:hypothetical protein